MFPVRCVRSEQRGKNEHADDATRLFRQNRRRLLGDVSFRVRCTLFTVFPFFSLSPNDETRETNSASEKRQTDSAHSTLSNLANISARDLDHRRSRRWRRLSGERDFPSGGDTVSPLFFFSTSLLLFAMIDEGDFPFRDRSRCELTSPRRSALLRICRLVAIIRANN